ncbi:MAG TPA: penicillin-binding protein 1C [Cytophagaceae bacterium]|jgi:penicillin-binding protein 1C|nr:penicillin-binding protein 1C [Cytophagaceae bacterium]
MVKLIKKKGIVFIFLLSVPVILFFILNFIFPFPIDNISYSQIILAKDSTVMNASLNRSEKWRMKTELTEIVPQLKEAFLYKEDKYFYYHPGFNPIAVLRAFINNVVYGKKKSGASTITMQVARLLEPKRRTYGSKLIELFRAIQLETKLSKDEILQLYLNLVPYGGNIEGVKSASVLYFDQLPNRLSLAQIVTLTIIPNRPTSLCLGKGNKKIKSERDKWLLRFRKDKIFPGEDIATAIEEPLDIKRANAPKGIPHISNRLKKKYPEENSIQTCIDKTTQRRVETITYNYIQHIKHKHIYNASVLVVNNQTMEVETYLGSPDFSDNEHNGQVDGVKALRSPGSALKPLVYAMGFDDGIITPKSTINDVPTDFNGYAPQNFDKKFNGKVSIETALSYSLNVPAVKILEQISVQRFVQKLKKASFKNVAKEERNLGLSAILGGCGVTLEEMTGLYCAFANVGSFMRLHYLKAEGQSGKVSLLSPMAAYMVTDILAQLTRPDLPNNYLNTYHVPLIAWKTGTSYGRRDAWSIGYNKKYTVAVWVGNFSGEGVPDLTGSDIATPLLFEIFNTLDYNASNNWFFKPDLLKFRFVCPETGKLPDEHCDHTVVDYYIPTVSSAEKCQHLKTVFVSADGLLSYCNQCLPEGGYKKEKYQNLEDDLIDYYRCKGIPLEEIPAHNPACHKLSEVNAPQIIMPADNKEYILDKEDPADIVLKCLAHNEVKKVFWYVNNEFYKEAFVSDKIFLRPSQGKIKISCSDDKGRNADISILVKYQ